jgi:hypothetical protein
MEKSEFTTVIDRLSAIETRLEKLEQVIHDGFSKATLIFEPSDNEYATLEWLQNLPGAQFHCDGIELCIDNLRHFPTFSKKEQWQIGKAPIWVGYKPTRWEVKNLLYLLNKPQ